MDCRILAGESKANRLKKRKVQKNKQVLQQENRISMISSREQKIALVQKFTLMSDVFISVALKDVAACQHVLRILTGIDDLVVREVRTQYTVSMITSHDARLDVLAEVSTGELYNIEIQRRDTVDHARRTRFYGSMIDSEYLQKGKTYSDLPNVHIIYISEPDLWHNGHTVDSVEQYFGGTRRRYENGMDVTYVNATLDDGSEIAKLMKYFKTADPDDMSQGDLSKRVRFLKKDERGWNVMCEVTDMFIQQGERRGRLESKYEITQKLQKLGMAVELIAEAVSEDVAVVNQWIANEKVSDNMLMETNPQSIADNSRISR